MYLLFFDNDHPPLVTLIFPVSFILSIPPLTSSIATKSLLYFNEFLKQKKNFFPDAFLILTLQWQSLGPIAHSKPITELESSTN